MTKNQFKQLPQYLLGTLLSKLMRAEFRTDARTGLSYFKATRFTKGWAGVSMYIILTTYDHPPMIMLAHEYGHQVQSQKLGWLYLLIIGLPSLLGNLLHRVFNFDYYGQPWEKQADSYGCVAHIYDEDRKYYVRIWDGWNAAK